MGDLSGGVLRGGGGLGGLGGGREGEREEEGETMAHDEDYDFLFFSFLFLTCIYILLDDENKLYILHYSCLSMLSLRYHLEVMDVVVSVPRKGYM